MKTEVADAATLVIIPRVVGRAVLLRQASGVDAILGRMITFQDLCLDVADARVAAAFWAPALGLGPDPTRPARLVDGIDEHTVWLNVVPEPRTVKQRVHLDLHVAAVSDLIDLGATVRDETQPWTVMADPEGGELCAFVREPAKLPDYRLYELAVDAADPVLISTWWADRYATEVQHDREQAFSWIEPASMPCGMVFCRVPEPKTVKNRLHWDVRGEVAEFLAAGATLLRARDEEISWNVLADPEGNEFCVFDPHGR
jgi:Glyoxalase-like domain